jgi:hypothetical protein
MYLNFLLAVAFSLLGSICLHLLLPNLEAAQRELSFVEDMHRNASGPSMDYSHLYPKTNATMASCLLVNDDTVKLTEWLAYHYTVLPLSHLIVAIDPSSLKKGKIRSLLGLWKDRLDHLEIWSNDKWMTLGPREGWRDPIYEKDGRLKRWFRFPKLPYARMQTHRRRQQHFVIKCMRRFQQLGQQWVLLTDTDEFLLYNYIHPDEDPSNFDGTSPRKQFRKKESYLKSVLQRRKDARPIRKALPPVGTVTIADFLVHLNTTDKCLTVPGVQINAEESPLPQVFRHVPASIDARKLMTLRHRMRGPLSGNFSKTIIDVSRVPSSLIVEDQVVTIHTPIGEVCPHTTASGSGTDYIAALLRLHHFAGTEVAFKERQTDSRRERNRLFYKRNVEPSGETDDMRPWIKAFVNKVGIQNATKLLAPLNKAYQQEDFNVTFGESMKTRAFG